MKAPFFTVLIDTYNYGEFIEEAVSTVLAQDFPPEQREILVVDDGSTDDTQERLWKFGEAIRYLRKPNGGQASAFNFGFEHARGKVIALLDADVRRDHDAAASDLQLSACVRGAVPGLSSSACSG